MRRRTWVVGGVLVVAVASVGLMVGSGSAAFHRFEAGLNGRNELSDTGERRNGDLNGVGTAVTRVNPATRTVCFRLTWAKIAAPSMAHIHDGDRTVNGPIVVTLFTTGDETLATDQDLPRNLRGVSGCQRNPEATRAVLRDIRDNPRQFYVNIHNDPHPTGAIRGQLHP